MILKKWSDIPVELKNDKTEEYYRILEKKKISLIIKRIFDIVISLILLIIASPVFIVLAIMIKFESTGPVFYRQERITQYGRIFKIFKFRTMVNNADKIGTLITLDNDSRITKIGKIIRKLRLDELPQLINIFVGDMSFVGTRPEVKKYVDAYSDEMKATLLLPAGVTSQASIEYKDEDKVIEKYKSLENDIDYIYINKILPAKMEWNLKYLKDFSFWKDIKICICTVFAVLNITRKEENEKEEILEEKESITK